MDDHRNATRIRRQKNMDIVGKDPVYQQITIEKSENKKPAKEKEPPKDDQITPSLSTRIDLSTPEPYVVGVKYIPPHPKHFKEISETKKRELEEDRKFCTYPITRIPSVVPATKLNINLQAPSAEIKEAKVVPRKASITPSQIYPEPPKKKHLKENQPKSGTIINVKKKRRVVKKKRVVPPPVREPTIEELIAQELATIQEFGEGEDQPPPPLPENYLTRQFRKKVAQLSKTTSYNAKDLTILESVEDEEEGEEFVEEEEDRFISRLSQKFRRDSEIKRYEPPKKKPKKGTLENFSFTKLKQTTLKTFYYGIKMATIHQGDHHFPSSSRNKQGICMPIAAYCFSILKHPDKWTQGDIDDILEAGNDLCLESAGFNHMHGDVISLKIQDLQKYCRLGNKKINFSVSEPEVSGMVRSEDKKVYNVTKAINVFFGRFKAGILQTEDFCVAMWKDKHYYFFDAAPRTLDLYSNPDGTASLAHFYDTASIISVLLDRSNLKNTSFVIYSISAFKVLDPRKSEQAEEESMIKESDNYQVLSAEKAVAQGSFDLADKCFGFSRNKQALTIAVIALVYSKITPCNAWHRGTIDKIVIIGNQLFLECIENDETEEVNLDDLPAVFTIGPYVVEIYISPNRFLDFMYKKGKCNLLTKLEKFFETNSNAIVQIDKSTIAVWKQRDVYHCFDPYSRNNEGFRSKNGTACVSMHTTLKSLVDTIAANFDGKDLIFRVHALKMCKIHRDPDKNHLFPRNLTMNEHPIEHFKKHRMKKGKRKATAMKITVDPATRATIGDVGDDSIMEVGSTVRSIGMEDLPPMVHKHRSKIMLALSKPLDKDMVVDLDSPSLSDTQIEPEPPEQPEGDVIDFKDVDAYDLTQEELELTGRGEGREGREGGGEDSDVKSKVKQVEKEMELMAGQGGEDDWYLATANFTQVGSHSLISRLSEEINTDFPIIDIPEEEVPVMVRNIAAIAKRKTDTEEPKYECEMTFDEEVNMWEEYMKDSNFWNLPDNSQIILGTKNMAQYGADLEIMAPFICIMAVTVASKYAIDSWSKDIVDYVLKCGAELHQNSNTRYDQNYQLEIARITLGSTDFSVKVDYIFDTYIKSKILATAIGKMLFPRCSAGILVTPTYSCAILCKKHLYYLYDGFGNNEVGLGKGTTNEGVACLARFTNIDHMVKRILHNKTKREKEENIEYNRFVLSSCCVKLLQKREKPDEDDEEELLAGQAEDGDVEEPLLVREYKKPPKEEPEPPKKPPKKGYHPVNGLHKIEGTKSLNSAGAASEMLKEDYFACVCACLLLLNNPLKTWDERKVDAALDEGVHIFNHAEDIDVCTKKFIKNVLLDDYIFDIITSRVVFSTFKTRRTLKTGIETLLQRKKQHFIIQFPNRCYTLNVDMETNTYHLFDPNDKGKASWTRYKSFRKLVNRIKSGIKRGSESYNFHSMEIMSIANAPKHVIISNRAKRYKELKEKKAETFGKPFHEQCSWLDVDIIPWSWKTDKSGLPKWNNWCVDFPNDLFSLFGTLSPLDEIFPETTGKRTPAFLVVAIGMTQIYELCDWNEAIMDSILLNGSIFFEECIKDITDENYELAFEDIQKECKIFPYSFRAKFTPVVEGTMFLVRLKQFNLYKSLRLFFDDYERRYGVICVTKGDNDRRLFAFGKLQESEYFLYDCETIGPPMYVHKDVGVPYILRATTLNRLLHVMTLTLKGGDFYVFDVGLSEMKTIE